MRIFVCPLNHTALTRCLSLIQDDELIRLVLYYGQNRGFFVPVTIKKDQISRVYDIVSELPLNLKLMTDYNLQLKKWLTTGAECVRV